MIGKRRALYRAVADADLEGIVGKHLADSYHPKLARWLKRRGRAEWFERQGRYARRRSAQRRWPSTWRAKAGRSRSSAAFLR